MRGGSTFASTAWGRTTACAGTTRARGSCSAGRRRLRTSRQGCTSGGAAHSAIAEPLWTNRHALCAVRSQTCAGLADTLAAGARVARHPHPGRGNSVLVSGFSLRATDGAARAGVLSTAHGELRTPAFMPVGTKATVKTVDPDELRELGTEIVLCNTYHLHFRPGADTIAELGGVHAFMGWRGPILTDSGGFQVFSLRHTILGLDDDGVTFRSVYDGEAARLTPELAALVQARL